MQLWTDYEGVTIDGAFPLKKLLLPEGRSAFFSTAGPKGEPTVVRLIECHFDEEAILARWRCVEALNHPNFLKFERYGQTELDGGPVVYAVFEKVDANLAEVLDQGHLTVLDAAQLASSLVAALDVLHSNGFIHEHIEPRNIFAVNDVVKLRSDCIREAPEGEEGRAAKQREVADLATVLLQALTQQQSVEGIPDYAVPPPFGQIIRNGLNGTWGLEKIKSVLEGHLGPTTRTAPKSAHEPSAAPAVTSMPDTKAIIDRKAGVDQKVPTAPTQPSMRPETQKAPAASTQPSMRPETKKASNGAAKLSELPEAQVTLPLNKERGAGDQRQGDQRAGDRNAGDLKAEDQRAADQRAKERRAAYQRAVEQSAEFGGATARKEVWGRKDILSRIEDWRQERNYSVRSLWLGAGGIAALFLLLSTWGIAHAWNALQDKAPQASAAVSQPAPQAAPQIVIGPATQPAAKSLPGQSLLPSPGSRANWRVISFTYNSRADAEKKVASLASSHPELQPTVFAPKGRAPYLVSIGGVMDRDAAYALARRSRSLGLPHDTYAQNYSH